MNKNDRREIKVRREVKVYNESGVLIRSSIDIRKEKMGKNESLDLIFVINFEGSKKYYTSLNKLSNFFQVTCSALQRFLQRNYIDYKRLNFFDYKGFKVEIIKANI